MVYFTEKLIHEIRVRSCIWDAADVNHLNKDVLGNMWMEIAESLYSDWNALSAFDQRDRVADLKKKWTNIKDSFVKDVKGRKPRKSRGPPEHRKKYYLFDHLQFLMPFIQDAKTAARMDGGDRLAEPSRKRSKNKSGCLQVEAVVGTAMAAAPTSRTYGTGVAGAGRPETPPDVRQHADALNNIAGCRPAADALCQLDGDLSFMVSLLPTIKSMNEKQKINFKIGVLQLLARIKFDEVLQHPLPDAAAYQPFATVADGHLDCFSGAYQPFPFINQAAVSSTQHRQQQNVRKGSTASGGSRPMKMKQETVDDNSSPPVSSVIETDGEDDVLSDDSD